MTYFIKKIHVAITLLLITSISVAYGDDDNRSACGERENCCSCQPACCCGQWFLEADLLYLRAYEGGLSSPCDSTHITDSEENGIMISRLNGKAHDPDFDWNLGYRIGAGYKFGGSNCGIGAFWTHYNSHTHGHKNHNNEHRWKLDFDVVDVLYGCECDVSNCFVLIPFGGLRYARIDQRLRTHFVNTSVEVPTLNSSSSESSSSRSEEGTRTTSRAHQKQEFFGVGPLLGFEVDWSFGCGFSLYGDISTAILYGTFHTRSNQTDDFTDSKNIDHLKKHTQACQAVVDAGLGVRWKTCFCCDKFLLLQLGLEHHQYFNHNHFCSYGDLSLDGVSLGVGIEY